MERRLFQKIQNKLQPPPTPIPGNSSHLNPHHHRRSQTKVICYVGDPQEGRLRYMFINSHVSCKSYMHVSFSASKLRVWLIQIELRKTRFVLNLFLINDDLGEFVTVSIPIQMSWCVQLLVSFSLHSMTIPPSCYPFQCHEYRREFPLKQLSKIRGSGLFCLLWFLLLLFYFCF